MASTSPYGTANVRKTPRLQPKRRRQISSGSLSMNNAGATLGTSNSILARLEAKVKELEGIIQKHDEEIRSTNVHVRHLRMWIPVLDTRLGRVELAQVQAFERQQQELPVCGLLGNGLHSTTPKASTSYTETYSETSYASWPPPAPENPRESWLPVGKRLKQVYGASDNGQIEHGSAYLTTHRAEGERKEDEQREIIYEGWQVFI